MGIAAILRSQLGGSSTGLPAQNSKPKTIP